MTVEVETLSGARILRIARPERRNALDEPTLRSLTAELRSASGDPSVRGVIFTGSPPSFVSGVDLQAFAEVRSASGARRLAVLGQRVVDAIHASAVPVIAAVNADAFGGGCELTSACDVRVAVRSARFHWVQARFAVPTAWGGTATLTSRVGAATALAWLLGTVTVDATAALSAGFVDEIAEEAASVDRARERIAALTRLDRGAVALHLRLLRHAQRTLVLGARPVETKAFVEGWLSTAHQEAVAAFLSRAR